ncbi:MAG: glycosyltransferase [Pseudomonadota bacterium]
MPGSAGGSRAEAGAMHVIGICRFSYPALGGFKRMHDTVEDREAYLYAPERMALRFRHFETLTLPSVAAQTDKRFRFLVLTGTRMPDIYRERLHALCAPVAQIRIVSAEPHRHRSITQEVIQSELGETEEESLQFRLDDDDAVATDFVRSIRRTARQARRLRATWRNLVIEYSAGYAVQLTPGGIMAKRIQGQFYACGLAVLFRPGDPKTVMNYGHHKMHHQMPTLIDPTTEMYLRAVHTDNDSKAGSDRTNLAPLDADTRALFKTRFNVDEAAVTASFTASGGQAGAQDALRDKA